MAGTQWTSKRRTLVISTFVFAFAAFLWVAAPQLVPTAELLGSDWQCTKTAFVLTTCTLFPQPHTGTAKNHHDDKVAGRTDAPWSSRVICTLATQDRRFAGQASRFRLRWMA